MKKTKLTRSLLAACSVVALSVALSGCLHSGGGGPTYSELDLMGYDTAGGASVEAGTYSTDDLPPGLVSALEGYTGPTSAGPGESLTIGDYTFTCGADSACSVTVAPDGSHFTVAGTVNVMVAMMPPPPPPDMDGDGVPDADDAFPSDPNESADSDGDGVGDNADAFPNDPAETADSDGDGVGDKADAFPNDPNETVDADGDGIGDNADPHIVADDRDNDGRPDAYDAFPDDPAETDDSDGDGIGDNADPYNVANDRDNDGAPDAHDAFPDDATETADSDGDGVGDNADAFPNDATETVDSDGDGVGDNAQAAAAAATTTKAAGTKLTAMATEAAQEVTGGTAGTDGDGGADAGLGGSARTDAEYAGGDDSNSDNDTTNDVYRLTISRDRDGTEVKVTDSNQNNKADPKFVDQMAGLDAGRVMFVRTQDADDDGNVVEEVVIVGTDIKAPRAVAFAKVDGQALNARDLDESVDADGDGTNNNDFTALFVATGAQADTITTATTAEVRALVKSSAFPLTGDATLNFDFDVANTPADEADEVRGYYNGSLGTYRCAGTAQCSVTIDADPTDATKRIITEMSAGWVFTPDAGVTTDVVDDSYLHYGFWLKKTTDADDVLTYNEIETFAGASFAASTATELATVTGTASYDGDAVGVYVHHVLSGGGGQIESSTSGHFKADANLMAHFGGTAVAAKDQFTVSGTLSNFDLSGGEANDWMVNLNRADFSGATDRGADAAPGTAHTNTFSGAAEGGGANGSWSGTFHGLTPDADGTGPGTVRTAPGSVVGEFNANMSNGSVVGAFGANKE